MTDIERIRVLHDLQERFDTSQLNLAALEAQIAAPDKRDNLQRFFAGFKIEDNCQLVCGCLPWVKLVHGLHELQIPETSKEEFQVPDYTVFYLTASGVTRPLVVDTKTATGDKQTLKVGNKQLESSLRYAETLGVPLLYAIFWAKLGIWTLNAPDQFKQLSSTIKIDMMTAIQNDLAVLLGDVTIINRPDIVRESRWDPSDKSHDSVHHPEHGALVSDVVIAPVHLDLEPLQAAALDAIGLQSPEPHVDEADGKRLVVERSEGPTLTKLSTLVLRLLALTNMPLEARSSRVGARIIADLAEQLGMTRSFSIPAARTPTTDLLYKEAFTGSSILADYESVHGTTSDSA